MTFHMLGLGTAQPHGDIEQPRAAAAAAELCCDTPQQRRLLETIYRQSRVRRRGSVLVSNGNGKHSASGAAATLAPSLDFYPVRDAHNERGPTVRQRMDAYAAHALPLAQEAASRALEQSDTAPDQIAHLITVSCTGFSAPGLDIQLIEALGLRRDTTRTMIGFMGCHGAINGLRTAQAMAAQADGATIRGAAPTARGRVLMCCLELCSLHFQYGWDTQQVVANALFADGAGAVVGEAADGGDGPWRLSATGSYLVPESRAAMSWSIGDHGFEMTLSPGVPGLIDAHLLAWLTRWLGDAGLTVADVGSWAVHPGGPRVLDAVEAALALPTEALATSRQVLGMCGNMSSPTVLFILEKLLAQRAALPCVALAFGPGLTIEAALFG
ncbi:MAG: type III polyketide synthase [Phycisphaeraceae bacterium]